MFKNAKIGDRVFSCRQGWGTIVQIDPTCECGLVYKYAPDEGYCAFWFTVSGRIEEEDLFPSVLWGEPKFEMPKRPLPELEVDAKVLVRMSEKNPWVRRYFHSFDEEGNLCTWIGGATEYSAQNSDSFTSWNYWKLYDEEENNQ